MSVPVPPFQELIDAHAAELHRFLVASLGPVDAEDCLQETFLAALRAYPRLRDASQLRAWLYTIAQRKAADVGRRRRRQRADGLDAIDTARHAEAAPGLPDDELWAAVRALPARQRAAVVHRFVLDLDYAAIAARMGGSPEAARQNVHAALRRLRLEVPDERT
jgi:RNA polymerase sigma factor (sigma-70 family)